MTDTPRFDWDAPPHQRHSPTSRAAAIAFLETAPVLRAKVYRAIAGSAGMTDAELFAHPDLAGYSQNAIRPRRCELCDAGLVRDSGQTRETPSGRMAVVWVKA